MYKYNNISKPKTRLVTDKFIDNVLDKYRARNTLTGTLRCHLVSICSSKVAAHLYGCYSLNKLRTIKGLGPAVDLLSICDKKELEVIAQIEKVAGKLIISKNYYPPKAIDYAIARLESQKQEDLV